MRQVAIAAELLDRLASLLGRDAPCRAIPPGSARNETPWPFSVRATIIVGRSAAIASRYAASIAVDVVTVDLDRAPPERLRSVAEHVALPSVHRRAPLAEPVEVEDRGQVADLVEGGRLHRLPDRPLGHLGVARAAPRRVPARRPAASRAPSRARPARPCPSEPVATSTHGSSGTGAGWPWIGEPDPPERQQLVVGDRADRLERRVEGRRSVALRHHEPVVREAARVRDVGAEVIGEQDGQQMGARTSTTSGAPSRPRSCIGCCRRRSARRGRSRAGSDRPSSLPVRLVIEGYPERVSWSPAILHAEAAAQPAS